MKKVVFILGPTCSGKSKAGVMLAKKINGEIISTDSVQIYKKFDIGSAKVTEEEMNGITHYGIDILNPQQEFSVFDFVEFTKEKINEISAKGKVPIVVGGTGLYVKALCEGYNFGQAEKRQEERKTLEKEIEEKGLESVFEKLKQLDLDLANKIDKNNKVRVIRAFEIAKYGKEQTKSKVDFDYKIFALCQDRQVLYARINDRVDQMMKSGVLGEVKSLYEEYGFVQPMRAIGYKEFIPYIEGKDTLENCVNLVKQHTRNYAKRQMTFLRTMNNIEYIDISDYEKAVSEIIEKTENFLNK